MTSLADRMHMALEYRRRTAPELNPTKAGLARACKVKPPSVNSWFSGDTKKLEGENLLRAAEYLGVRPEWLATGRGKMTHAEGVPVDRANPSKGELQETETKDSGTQIGSPLGSQRSISIPLMAVEPSMGRGSLAPVGDEVVIRMEISEQWLRRNATFTAPENLCLVAGLGDSMSPTYLDGDVLLVDKGVRDVRIDAVYVLALNDELYVKRLQRRPSGAVLMISDNKSYEPYEITAKDRASFRVIGRVVMAWNAKRM